MQNTVVLDVCDWKNNQVFGHYHVCKTLACVKSHLITMHLRIRQQPDICADSSGLFTQQAAGLGIV